MILKKNSILLLLLLIVCILYSGCSNGSQNISWKQVNSETEEHLYGVHFLDNNRGWTVGSNGLVLSSDDGGRTWNGSGIDNGIKDTLNHVSFLTPQNGWLVSIGKIHYTSSGGKTWNVQHQLRAAGGRPPGILDLHFVNTTEGWAVGGTNQKGISTILHTQNGGSQWEKVNNPSEKHLWGVYFVDTEHGWLVGQSGELLHTKDGGKQWVRQITNVEQPLFAVHFVDRMKGWVVGTKGLILHTSDGGNTWKQQQNQIKQSLRDVVFQNENIGWAVGEEGLILSTSDGGTTWNKYPSPTTNNLQDIYVFKNRGWIVGEKGTILLFE